MRKTIHKNKNKKPAPPTPDPNARYRVRDRAEAGTGEAKVWSPDGGLTMAEAVKLRDFLLATKRSTTVRIEPIPEGAAAAADTPSEPSDQAAQLDFANVDDATAARICRDVSYLWTRAIVSRVGQAFKEMGAAGGGADANTVYVSLVERMEPFVALLIETAVDVRRRAAIVEVPAQSDPELEAMRQAALDAARPVAQAAQARHDAKAKPMVQPPHKPPPSPLSDEVLEGMPDAEPPLEEQFDDGEVHDILGGVGGGPGADDAKRAAALAARDKEETLGKAQAAYRGATSKLPGIAVPWESMDDNERAAWEWYVIHGGVSPAVKMAKRAPEGS